MAFIILSNSVFDADVLDLDLDPVIVSVFVHVNGYTYSCRAKSLSQIIILRDFGDYSCSCS